MKPVSIKWYCCALFMALFSQLLFMQGSLAKEASLIGEYKRGPLTIEFAEDGSYRISMEGRVAIQGQYQEDDGNLLLEDTGGPMACPKQAQYQYRVDEKGLQLGAVNDPCAERGENISGVWEGGSGSATLAITNGTLIDGNGGKPQKNMTVVVEYGKIVDIFHSGKKDLPENAELINAKGKYIIPGLIDSHVHFATSPSDEDKHDRIVPVLKNHLKSGITSVRDMGGDARSLAWLARNAKTGEIESPNIYFSAIIAGPGFFSDGRTVASAQGEKSGHVPWQQAFRLSDDVKETISKVKGSGATGIKMYAELGPKEVKALSDEAHRQGLQVWSHAYIWPALPSDAVAAGVDVVSHSSGLSAEVLRGGQSAGNFMESRIGFMMEFMQGKQKTVKKVVKSKDFQKLLKDMQKNGTILDSTVMIGLPEEEEMDIDEEEEEGEGDEQGFGPPGGPEALSEAMMLSLASMTREAYKAEVLISAGTDSAYDAVAAPPLFKEMELLVNEVGMTPLEAMTSATKISAMATGIDKTHGTIEKGKVADIVILARNPAEDIRNANSAEIVLKAGEVYKNN